MANSGDSLVNAFANEYSDRVVAGSLDVDESDLFDELENFDDSSYRSARLQQLSSEIKAIKSLPQDHGKYMEITDEKEVLTITTSTERVVAHFFHADFARCKIMDRHLDILAQRHIHTRFIKINVDNVPFLVTKLQIQVLPCVIPFVNAIGKERILGFEGLGGDNFPTGILELALRKCGAIRNIRGQQELRSGNKSIMGFADRDEEYDSDE